MIRVVKWVAMKLVPHRYTATLTDVQEIREVQAQILKSQAEKRDIDIRIARVQGAVRVLTAADRHNG